MRLRRNRAPDRDAAGTRAFTRKVLRRRIVMVDQIVGAGDKILPSVRLSGDHSGLMPGFTEPAAAARMADGKDAAALHPRHARCAERWIDLDAVRSVAFQIRRMRTVELEVFAIDDRERDHSAVLTACRYLGRRV